MTDERHDDEVLGRALSRAIETQTLNETPFERSRIAERPARRSFSFWQFAGVAAALLLALAFGSWFTRPSDTGPVASSATPTTGASNPSATGAPASATPTTDITRTFFVRDLLPPVSAFIPGTTTQARADQRIGARLTSTFGAPAASVPFGAANPLALVGKVTTTTGGSGSFGVSVLMVTGDTASVEFDLPNGWGVHGAAQVQALIQQLVYVITEEPGIRKALITEKGKTNAVIDGLIVDKPLSREDVTDYDHLGSTQLVLGHGDATAAASRKLTARGVVDQMVTPDGAMTRFEIDTDLQNVSPTVSYPDFNVQVFANDEAVKPLGGKWRMVVTVNGTDASTGTQKIDKSPLRSIVANQVKCCLGLGTPGSVSASSNVTVYEIGLDDLRPWRTAIAYNPFRIIIDIGGDPRTISGDNAVYAPAYGAAVARTFQVSGIAHNFEANVVIRVRDDKQKEIYKTSTTATNCCDPGGTFDATVQLPTSVSGNIYLEVFEASAKDGSDTKLIRIPLTVR